MRSTFRSFYGQRLSRREPAVSYQNNIKSNNYELYKRYKHFVYSHVFYIFHNLYLKNSSFFSDHCLIGASNCVMMLRWRAGQTDC